MRLVNNEKVFLKYISKPTYISHKIFGKSYAAIHEIKPILILNKPIYAGFTVLDLSKWKMYGFHYNFIKKILMLNCYFLTQTVLLMKFFKWKDLFDYGNYSKDFKAIGKMKDKFGGIMASEFVGLKSNMFLIKKN